MYIPRWSHEIRLPPSCRAYAAFGEGLHSGFHHGYASADYLRRRSGLHDWLRRMAQHSGWLTMDEISRPQEHARHRRYRRLVGVSMEWMWREPPISLSWCCQVVHHTQNATCKRSVKPIKKHFPPFLLSVEWQGAFRAGASWPREAVRPQLPRPLQAGWKRHYLHVRTSRRFSGLGCS